MKILLCLPNTDDYRNKTVNSIIKLTRMYPEITETYMVSNSLVGKARDECCRYFLKSENDYLLFIDSDMEFNHTILRKLLDHKKDIICALAFSRVRPVFPCITRKIDGEHKAYFDYYKEPDGLTQIDGCGMAFTLISRKVIEKMGEEEWFLSDHREDIGFCNKALDNGFKIYCDTSCKINHITDTYSNENVYLDTIKRRKPSFKILIGSPVNQTEEVFSYYLKSLKRLKLPKYYKADFYFIVNGNLKICKMLEDNQYEVYECENNFNIGNTHNWDNRTISQVALMRNGLIRKSLYENYDYLFMVDSDLVLHKNTLCKLFEANKDIIAEIFWTQWQADDVNSCGANTWHIDTDQTDYVEALSYEFKGVYQTGYTGACTLISHNAMSMGCNYERIPNISFWGEDRWFCIRAYSLGIPIYIDTHYPCIHLYNKKELEWYKLNKDKVLKEWDYPPVKKIWLEDDFQKKLKE